MVVVVKADRNDLEGMLCGHVAFDGASAGCNFFVREPFA
jgi:hypothetical protein